jgi:hypothetical protein
MTLDMEFPLKIKGYFDEEMLELVNFILTSKFQLKRQLTIKFWPKETYHGVGGMYRCAEVMRAYYNNNKGDLIGVAVNIRCYSLILNTIAHELRHAEQNHYKFLYRAIESRAMEKDARDFAKATVQQFIDYQKDQGVFKEKPLDYRLQID